MWAITMLIVVSSEFDLINYRLFGWNEVGRSVEGRPIRMAEFGRGDRTVLFVGMVHGNEFVGKELLLQLYQYLKDHPEEYAGRRVLILPVANPDGVAANTRVNADKVDINRNFPTENWVVKTRRKKYKSGASPASEPETKLLIRIIEEERPKAIVSIHQPFACINYDGPAAELAEKLVNITGLELKQDIGYNTPGSFGTFTGMERGIPTITMELPWKVVLSDYESKYIPALVEVIKSF